jgi:hypothetical protein
LRVHLRVHAPKTATHVAHRVHPAWCIHPSSTTTTFLHSRPATIPPAAALHLIPATPTTSPAKTATAPSTKPSSSAATTPTLNPTPAAALVLLLLVEALLVLVLVLLLHTAASPGAHA